MSELPLLEVRGVSAGYGRSQVLFDVSLSAKERGAIAVLGRNGAGKTTLMKTIMGELGAAGGAVPRLDAHADRPARTAGSRLRAAGICSVRAALSA